MENDVIYFTVTNDLVTDQRMQRITESLVKKDRKVVLIGRILRSDQKAEETNNGVKWIRFNLLFNKGKFFYLEYNIRLVLFFLFKNVKSICAIDFDTLPAIYILKKIKKFDFIFDAHEYFTEVPELKDRKFEKNIWSKIAARTIPQAQLCYTVNESISKIYTDLFKKKFHVIRNVPLRSEPSKSSLTEPKIILYQGALNADRGIEESILAMNYFPHNVLWIAGSGDIETELKELVKNNNLENKVKFLGRLDPQSLKDITSRAWVGLNILQGDSLNYYYSLANKFFDYVQAGVPGISMKFPEYIYLNEEHEVACLLDSCSVDDIVVAIRRLEEYDYYEKLKKNTVVAAKAWNWEKESENLYALYAEI